MSVMEQQQPTGEEERMGVCCVRAVKKIRAELEKRLTALEYRMS